MCVRHLDKQSNKQVTGKHSKILPLIRGNSCLILWLQVSPTVADTQSTDPHVVQLGRPVHGSTVSWCSKYTKYSRLHYRPLITIYLFMFLTVHQPVSDQHSSRRWKKWVPLRKDLKEDPYRKNVFFINYFIYFIWLWHIVLYMVKFKANSEIVNVDSLVC